jgi:hypothetical protein
MSGWFDAQILDTGRLPLFCFFVAFVVSFGFIRLSARLIRAKVRWWPGNVVAGDVHVHHMVFGVVLMTIGGVAQLAAPLGSLDTRAAAAGLFGLGTALVLDEFALILHLRDVYWSNEGRISVDAVFVAAGVTALLQGVAAARQRVRCRHGGISRNTGHSGGYRFAVLLLRLTAPRQRLPALRRRLSPLRQRLRGLAWVSHAAVSYSGFIRHDPRSQMFGPESAARIATHIQFVPRLPTGTSCDSHPS